MLLMNKPGRNNRVIKAQSSLGTNSKRRSEAAAFFISLRGINKRDKAIRIQYDVGRKDDVTKIRWAMVLIPFVMVAVLGAGLWVAVNEFKKLNPPAYESVSSTDLPAAVAGMTSEAAKENQRLLTLVNLSTALPEDYQVNLKQYGGVQCDAAVAGSLQKMAAAAKEQGLNLQVTQGYVDAGQQQEMYLAKVEELKQGLSQVKAEEEAKKQVPPGGKSENQTGLAVELTAKDLPDGADFKTTAEYNWLILNGADYGFVLRYAENKTGVTKMSFSSTHFRYVGVENAKRMRMFDMSLEEYTDYIAGQQKK